MGLVQYDNQEYRVQRVYYTGTAALETGQPLCYQESPATASIEKAFPFDVEVPNSSNKNFFAGIVPPTENGTVGPAYIDIIVPQPNDILQVRVSNIAAVAVGDELELTQEDSTASVAAGFRLATLDSGTVATSAAQNAIVNAANAQALDGVRKVKAIAMEALTDTVTAVADRDADLKWVQFI